MIYSNLGRRFIALILDSVILGVMGLIAGHLIPVLGSLLVWFFYAPVLESSALQATIGKQLMGIQVTDLSGNRISFQASLIRNVMKLVSSALMCLGYVVAFFSGRKQALHDIVAETVVVDGKANVALADAWTDETKALFRSSPFVSGSASGPTQASYGTDVASQLERIKALRDRGELNETEYQAAKDKILRS